MVRIALVPLTLTAVALGVPAGARAQAPEAPGAYRGADGEAGFILAELQTPGALTAEEATRRAVATAPSVSRAAAAVRLAEAGAAQAYAGLYPRVDLAFTYTRLFNVEDQSFADPLTQEQIDQLNAAVEAVRAGGRPADIASAELHAANVQSTVALATNGTFPIFKNRYAFTAQLNWPVSAVFLQVMPAYEAAQRSEEAARHSLRAEQSTVALRAREAYYAYARAVGARIVAEASLEQVSAQREDIRVLVEAGSAAPVELERANALAASAQAAVAAARGGVRVAAAGLRILLHDADLEALQRGTGIGEDLTTLPPPVAGTPQEMADRALVQRSEVRALEEAMVAAGLRERSANGRKVPVLSVNANLDYSNPNQIIIPQRDEFYPTYNLGAALTWSPNEFFDADAVASQASAEAAQTRADLEALEDAVRLEVAQAYENYVTAIERYDAQVVGIRAAEETYRVRREQLGAGTVVQTDLVQAESELTSARLDLLDAAIDAHVADAQLRRAVDELL